MLKRRREKIKNKVITDLNVMSEFNSSNYSTSIGQSTMISYEYPRPQLDINCIEMHGFRTHQRDVPQTKNTNLRDEGILYLSFFVII